MAQAHTPGAGNAGGEMARRGQLRRLARPRVRRVAEYRGVMPLERFYKMHVTPGVPVVMRGAAREWPAARLWTPAFLAQLGASTPVIVSRSNEEVEATVKDHSMTLAQFVTQHMSDRRAGAGAGAGAGATPAPVPAPRTAAPTPPAAVASPPTSAASTAHASAVTGVPGTALTATTPATTPATAPATALATAPATALATAPASTTSTSLTSPSPRGGGSCVPYLKQFDLLRVFPQLRSHLRCASLFSPRTVFGTVFAWVGPRGTVTGTHSDDENNVSVQLHGRKRFMLAPQSQRRFMYANSKYDSGTECCDVCMDEPDLGRHPLFAQVTELYQADLGPGDVLFVPKFWFHHVRSLSPSISVNYFASTPWEMVKQGSQRWLWAWLHAAGIVGNGNCVCHAPPGNPRCSPE